MVDDEPDIVKTVGKRLEMSGYEVLVAADGQEGLRQARRSHPDLILLDLTLPNVGGLEVCATLKRDARHRHIPIMIFSARGTEADEQRSREAGADAYVNKSSGSAVLLEQIEALLTRAGDPARVSEQGEGDAHSGA